MIDVALDDGASLLRGAAGVERASGLTPVRLPRWACAQAREGFTQDIFRMASGVRIALTTEATALELDVDAAGLAIVEDRLAAFGRPLVCDLLVDGREAGQRTIESSTRLYDPDSGSMVDASPRVRTTLRFDGLPSARKDVELWLPQNGIVELLALRADAPVQAIDEALPRWIHHGSSISHCLGAHSPTATWPAHAALRGGWDLLNLGFAGNCHLDPFVARFIRDEPADFISLKVGINIVKEASFTERTLVPGLHGFIDTIRDGHPATPIVVVSPIIAPQLEREIAPGGSDGSLTIGRVRELLAEVVDARAAGDSQIRYLDGLSLFGPRDAGDLPDGAHPSGDGYLRLAERFARYAFNG